MWWLKEYLEQQFRAIMARLTGKRCAYCDLWWRHLEGGLCPPCKWADGVALRWEQERA